MSSPCLERFSRRRGASVTAALVTLVLAAGCEREMRRFQAPAAAADPDVVRQGELQPGPAPDPVPVQAAASAPPGPTPAGQAKESGNPLEENAYAVSQGKRLYRWYNCNGCHASGGGGMGPPLMDGDWLYGGQPAQIVATILQGRPNGMPSFAGRIPEDQVWQIAAYVRSMSGQLQIDVAPGRSDSIHPAEPEQRRELEGPAGEAAPAAAPR